MADIFAPPTKEELGRVRKQSSSEEDDDIFSRPPTPLEESRSKRIGTSEGQTFAESAADTAALGYGPEIQSKMEPITDRLFGLVTGQDVEPAPWSQLLSNDENYVRSRDKNVARRQEQAKLNPKAELGGMAAGALLSSALPMGILNAGKGAKLGGTLLTGVAQGAAQNPGSVEGEVDPLQLKERSLGGATGGILSGAGYGVGKAISAVPKFFKGSNLSDLAEDEALRQTGAPKGVLKKILKKDEKKLLGRALLDESADVLDDEGNVIGREKILRLGDDAQNLYEKTSRFVDETGKKIGAIYKPIDAKMSDPNFIDSLTDKQRNKLMENINFIPSIDTPILQEELAIKYGGQLKGKETMAKLQSIFEDMKTREGTLDDNLALKGELDSMIDFAKENKELKAYQQALVDIRNHIRDRTNKFVDTVADVVADADPSLSKQAKELRKLNKQYSAGSKLTPIALDKAAGEAKNRRLSPSDYYTAGTGAALGLGASGGDPGDTLIAGGAGLLANRLGRKYGPGMAARFLDQASKVVEKSGLKAASQAIDPFTSQLPGLLGVLAPRTDIPNREKKKR